MGVLDSPLGIKSYLLCSVQYTYQPSEIVGVNVPDESALHWVHVLIPAKIQNKIMSHMPVG